jgi:hypothetical protein
MKFTAITLIFFTAGLSYAQTARKTVAVANYPACPGGACAPASGAYWANYGHCGRRCQAAFSNPWQCGYYYTPWGAPTALVVPPTAEKQYSMGWGVGNTRLTRIYQQYGRPYPGAMLGPGGRFLATPYWPSDTAQFGVYYVRGPW